MKFFYKLRNDILKRGYVGAAGSVSIHNLRLPQDAGRFGPPPPNARGFFAEDSAGGMGWNIVLPDGSTEKYYIELPADIGCIETLLVDAPVDGTKSAAVLVTRYMSALREVLIEAKAHFGSAG
jgi:hypothetical protein